MLAQPRMFSCILSSGSTWSMPSIYPEVGDLWPTGGQAGAYAVFTDLTGAVLATVDGTISAQSVDFTAISHTVVDPVPAGANCEVFITDSDGRPYKIRYGRVVRREVSFPAAPNQVPNYQPVAFADSLQRSALGANWVPLGGSTTLHDNSGASQPWGLGATNEILSVSAAAVRWFQPLSTNNWRINVNLLHKAGIIASQLLIIGSADINMTSGLACWFKSGAATLQIGSLAGAPSTATVESSVISETVVNGNNYTIAYNDNTKTIAVYKGTGTTPVVSWNDAGGAVPQGAGYRYVGLAWNNLPLTNGLEVSGWAAQDAL